jgi:hypothetical protein
MLKSFWGGCMKKVLIGLLAGLVMMVVWFGFSQLFSFVFPGLATEYQSAMFRPWSDPLMMLYFLYPFVLGIALSFFWAMAKGMFKGNNAFERGLKLAFMYLVIATIPGMLITYSSFQISLLMTVSWAVNGFIEVFAGGVVFAWLSK